jgi:hypothetical protein
MLTCCHHHHQIVINDVQYRGRLEPSAVLRAICAGFEEGTEPPLCLGAALQVRAGMSRISDDEIHA